MAVGAVWQAGDSGGIPLSSQEFLGESSCQLWGQQTIHLFLLPENVFWTIILPASNTNTIHYIILSLGTYGCFMVLEKPQLEPKG